MGIQNFNGWLRSSYNNSYVKELQNIDNLYIDLNCLLHKCGYKVDTSEQVIKRLKYNINNILKVVNPSKSIIFASDGVPPLAKTLLQRKRRIASINKMCEEIKNISSLDFTVGSEFMNSLEDNLGEYVKDIEKKRKIQSIFLCDGPNEAELKITYTIKQHKNGNHVIVSDDADVILLASAINVDNIYVLSYENKKEKILSIDLLLNEHKKRTGCNRNDFVFVSLLLGNDYIPKLNFINIDILWNAYINFKNNKEHINESIISSKGNLQLKYLKQYIMCIVRDTSSTLNKRTKINNINPGKVNKYIEGLIWCFQNYSEGTCQKYDYVYNGKTIQPLQIVYSIICENIKNITYPTPSCGPMDKDKYLILIMPRKAKKLVKQKYHDTIDNHLNFLYEEEECEKCKTYAKQINKLNKTIIICKNFLSHENDNDSNEKLNNMYLDARTEISSVQKKLKEHKLTHSPVDIYKAIRILNSI